MHGKALIVIFFLVTVILMESGCSASRRAAGRDDADMGSPSGMIAYSDLHDNNVVGDGLFIRKFRADLRIDGINDRFSGNLRVDNNGVWLVSIRMLGGIEVFRIHADRNEVVVLDRLARTATIFDWKRIERDYGITYEVLPATVGDAPFIDEMKRMKLNCGGVSEVMLMNNSILINADCRLGKISMMTIIDPVAGRELTVEYGAYKNRGSKVLPEEILVAERTGTMVIRLNFEEAETPWNEAIEFEIPSNYRIKR
jgi:hypothetical protein